MTALEITYLVPLATGDDEDVGDLATYLGTLAAVVGDVIVVDGSAPLAVERHRVAFGPGVRVLEPEVRTPMGKVGNVLTGIAAARFEHVVIADDDVRYRIDQLRAVDSLLERATVVRPQNHFHPLPWHARFDTARTLLARVSGGDWPGTLAVHRSAVQRAGGYRGDVLFENLELVRTLVAAGGRERLALDVIVQRVPPTTAHFRGQQIRQAYDELARPGRLSVFLAVLPLFALGIRRRRWRALVGGASAIVAAAEVGRRRAHGRDHFPASSTLLAPAWVVWRSACSWAALGAWIRGGARYRGGRLRTAASSRRTLRRRLRSVEPVEPGSDHRDRPSRR